MNEIVRGRPSIRDIPKNVNKNTSTNRSNHDLANDISESDSEETHSFADQSGLTENLENRSDSWINGRKSSQGEFEDEKNHFSLQKSAIVKQQLWNMLLRYKIPLLVLIFLACVQLFGKSEPRECSFEELKDKYRDEKKEMWSHLKSGNEDILNNKSDKPAVFLFVSKGEEVAKRIVNDIAHTSAKCFGSSPIIQELKFDTKEAIADYGHVVDAYKKSIKEKNVIVLANLTEIPAEAAKALHSICDTTTPLVKKVIILLSLTLHQRNMEDKLIDSVEKELKELWEDKIEANELYPIIVRVTDEVFLLRSH